jgi:hypothetical protein
MQERRRPGHGLRTEGPLRARPRAWWWLGAAMVVGMVLAEAVAQVASSALAPLTVPSLGFCGLVIAMSAVMTLPPALVMAAKHLRWKEMAVGGLMSAAVPIGFAIAGSGLGTSIAMSHLACQSAMVLMSLLVGATQPRAPMLPASLAAACNRPDQCSARGVWDSAGTVREARHRQRDKTPQPM